MASTFALVALWVVPLLTFLWARRRAPRKVWRLTGVSLGFIVAPASSGLYGLYFVGPLVALLGLIGFPLAMFHGEPGFELATLLGLREPRTVVQGVERIYIALLNAVVWSVVYGGLGWAVDRSVGTRKARSDAA